MRYIKPIKKLITIQEEISLLEDLSEYLQEFFDSFNISRHDWILLNDRNLYDNAILISLKHNSRDRIEIREKLDSLQPMLELRLNHQILIRSHDGEHIWIKIK